MRGTFSENLHTFMSSIFIMEIVALLGTSWSRRSSWSVPDSQHDWNLSVRQGRLAIDVEN